ncbi:addiction module antitoxin, RelB/DinJ family [Serratia fonticola]|uniref:Addiction module antitoxin, RelB/DinJ family n=1 Tax=Serratia fonticola TaxID=47917 RepID=A0A4U9VYP3_SERFO|nr:addiction module antitoxin, RelB/DinJ family [Serratia fonticola]
MNEQAQIGIKLDKALKEDVDIILRGLGIKPTMAITGLYQYILRHGALPFIIHTQVHTPQTLFGHLFMDYSVLKRTLGGILQPLTDGGADQRT